MITLKEAREKLGETGKRMTDEEIEKLKGNLYAFINQILDNNIEVIKLCKDQQRH